MEGGLFLYQGCQVGLYGEIGKIGYGGYYFGQVGVVIQVMCDEVVDDQVVQMLYGGWQVQVGFQVVCQVLLYGFVVYGLVGGFGYQGWVGWVGLGLVGVVVGSGGVDQGRMMNRYKRL